MKKMRLLMVLATLFVSSALCFAQVATNPDADFYHQVNRWETMGLITQQPLLRPYAIQHIEKILNTVIEGPNEIEKERALELYEEIFNKPWILHDDTIGTVKASYDGNFDFDKQLYTVYTVDGDAILFDYFGISYNFGAFTGYNALDTIRPSYVDEPLTLRDRTVVKSLSMCAEANSAVTFSWNDIYVMAGINHNSFGPFQDDCLVFSSHAKHTTNFSLTYAGDFVTFTDACMGLTATDGFGNYETPQKYLMVQAVTVTPVDWFSLTFYQSAIYGQRFEFAYIVPMTYIVTESVTGYNADNEFMGGAYSIRLPKNVNFKGELLIDDVSITGFDTYGDIRLRCAGQTGVEYAPEEPLFGFINFLSLKYGLVTPYMYTHVPDYADGQEPSRHIVNFQTYESSGKAIGPSIKPNSDRLVLNAEFTPFKDFEIDFTGTMIRHGNVNEGLSMAEKIGYLAGGRDFATDGSFLNHAKVPTIGVNQNSTWHCIYLLTQEHIEYTWQAELKASYKFPKQNWGQVSVSAGYIFEYIHNYGVGNNIFTNDPFLKEDGSFTTRWEGLDKEAEVNKLMNDWVSNLKDVFNNYFTINVTYRF